MFSILDYVLFAIGAVLLVIWILLFLIGKKDAGLFDVLEEKEYPLKEIYFVGYAAVNLLHYQYKSKNDRKLRKEISVLYGEKYADYYLRVIYAQKITMAFTLAVLAFALYGIADTVAMTFVFLLFAGTAYYYYGTATSQKILARSEEMMRDFSNVVSKLALLTNAGMIMKEAWEKVAYTGESTIYLEMQKVVEEMNNGISETEAIFRFGNRCILPEIKKFASTIIQGIEKGNSELTVMLRAQSSEVWNLKKQNVRRQGEKAASKLMIPLMMMFVGILIMVIVPIFTNLGV